VDLALAYRQRFSEDVVIDMVCYRRHGHNEGDEPSFTQPLLYEKIRNTPVRQLYAGVAARGGVLPQKTPSASRRRTSSSSTRLE
jgi:2-oxoglutarate dehydrogenase complex dehydrogenase (E1) component-like enzyme